MPNQIIAAGPGVGYFPIAVLFFVVTAAALVIVALSHLLPKQKRVGPVKDATYESGVEPIGDARRRFNIRFYLVAMLFLLFDVELIFMYPWAVQFFSSAMGEGAHPIPTGFLLGEMVIFTVILLVGYAYAWRKKVFSVS